MPEKAAPKARYYHKGGKIYDAGVEISDGEIERMRREYPQKMERNKKVGDAEPMTRSISEFANKKLQQDLDEINAATAERDKGKAKPAK